MTLQDILNELDQLTELTNETGKSIVARLKAALGHGLVQWEREPAPVAKIEPPIPHPDILPPVVENPLVKPDVPKAKKTRGPYKRRSK